jgi:hypothetical protein
MNTLIKMWTYKVQASFPNDTKWSVMYKAEEAMISLHKEISKSRNCKLFANNDLGSPDTLIVEGELSAEVMMSIERKMHNHVSVKPLEDWEYMNEQLELTAKQESV